MTGLKTEDIYLRIARPEDAEIIYNWENDEELWSFTDEPGPVSMEDIQAFLSDPFNDIHLRKQLRLMICLRTNDEVAGSVDLYEFNALHHRAGIGINIAKEYRKQGLANQALKLAIIYTGQILGLRQIWAIIPASNIASLRLFNSVGFTNSGTLVDWLYDENGSPEDVIFMQLLLG